MKDAGTPKKPRGRAFAKGNPGRPRGSRNSATVAAEAILDGQAAQLTQKAVELAIAGDVTALRLTLERILPARKERPVVFDLPSVSSAADHPAALVSVLEAVATGHLTPGEAQAFSGVLREHRTAIETAELASRLDALEVRVSNNGK